jgi:Glycosyltransferase family 87
MGSAMLVFTVASNWGIVGFDAVSYWLIDPTDLYRWTGSTTVAGPFRYSPALGQFLDPLGALPWTAFQALFLAACLLALVLLGGRCALALLLIPNVLGEVYLGNIDLFVASSLGLGLLWPPAWAFLILSKGTPAVVLLWFVVRGEWRSLGLVLGATALLAAPSLLTTPGLWLDWARVSTQYASTAYGASQIPVVPRIIAAALLVGVGGRRGWRWTIAVAGTLAMPGLDWKTMTTMLAILPLYQLGALAERPPVNDGPPPQRRPVA